MSNRLDKEKEAELQPIRIEEAVRRITAKGYEIVYEDGVQIKFFFKQRLVTFFPYSGWATGWGIKSGRGLQNLLKQI